MGKMVHKTAAELEAAWKERIKRIEAGLPRTYKQFCAQCQQVSVTWMNKLVYMRNSPNRRTGAMKRNERLVFYGIFEAAIVNRVRSEWAGERYPYPLAVHYGRRAMGVPTRRGRKAYAWMWNRASKRPGSDDGDAWRDAVASGKGVVAPRGVGPSEPRPWRDRMIETMRGVLAKMTSKQIMDIFTRH